MKNLIFAFRKLAVFLIFFSCLCVLPAQVNSRNVVEQERMISGFTSISVDDGIDVHLSPGVHTKVVVKADAHLLSKLKTELSGQELKIRMDGSYRKVSKLEVYLEMPVLVGVTASGSSDVFTTGSFELKELYIRLGQGSDLHLDMIAQKVSCNLSDGADAKLQGKVNQLTAEASGSSILSAKNLEIQKCTMRATSGSDAFIWVTGELEMEAHESSGIYYRGTPVILHQKTSSNSDIRAL